MTQADRDKTPPIDFLRPIVADADTGHGGISANMKLVKMFVERGAAGVHVEDQVLLFLFSYLFHHQGGGNEKVRPYGWQSFGSHLGANQ